MDTEVLIVMPHGVMRWSWLSEIQAEPERFVQSGDSDIVFYEIYSR